MGCAGPRTPSDRVLGDGRVAGSGGGVIVDARAGGGSRDVRQGRELRGGRLRRGQRDHGRRGGLLGGASTFGGASAVAEAGARRADAAPDTVRRSPAHRPPPRSRIPSLDDPLVREDRGVGSGRPQSTPRPTSQLPRRSRQEGRGHHVGIPSGLVLVKLCARGLPGAAGGVLWLTCFATWLNASPNSLAFWKRSPAFRAHAFRNQESKAARSGRISDGTEKRPRSAPRWPARRWCRRRTAASR